MAVSKFFVPRTTARSILLGATAAVCLVAVGERAGAFRGGFGGFHGGRFGGFGGFHGGSTGSRFGDGGMFDRSSDSGFGRGGWGSVHNANTFSDHADTFQRDRPEYQHNASQPQQNRFNDANQLQQSHINETNTLNENRFAETRNLQYHRETTFNNYSHNWGGYYSGAGFGAGLAIGATMMALPAAAIAISAASHPYYYSGGVYYEPQGGQYVVVPRPQGAPHSSRSSPTTDRSHVSGAPLPTPSTATCCSPRVVIT